MEALSQEVMFAEIMATIRLQAGFLQRALTPNGLGKVTSKLSVPLKLFHAWVAGMTTLHRQQDFSFWYTRIEFYFCIFIFFYLATSVFTNMLGKIGD
jgi:hypothetical protein